MSDDLNKKRPQDASKVNIHEDWEVTYWCKTLNYSKADLIKAVGTSSQKVKQFLSK